MNHHIVSNQWHFREGQLIFLNKQTFLMIKNSAGPKNNCLFQAFSPFKKKGRKIRNLAIRHFDLINDIFLKAVYFWTRHTLDIYLEYYAGQFYECVSLFPLKRILERIMKFGCSPSWIANFSRAHFKNQDQTIYE